MSRATIAQKQANVPVQSRLRRRAWGKREVSRAIAKAAQFPRFGLEPMESRVMLSSVKSVSSAAVSSVQSAVAPLTDLTVTNLQTNPSNPSAGNAVTIAWNDAIAFSPLSAATKWTDHITVVNVTTSQIVGAADVLVTTSALGNQPTVSYTLLLPSGIAGVGTLNISVTADVNNDIAESNEMNNTTSKAVFSTAPPVTIVNPPAGVMAVLYDPATGDVSLDSNGYQGISPEKPFSGKVNLVEFISAGGIYKLNKSVLDHARASSILPLGSPRTSTDYLMTASTTYLSDGEDFGNILAPNLDPAQLAAALTIKFNYFGSGAVSSLPAALIIKGQTITAPSLSDLQVKSMSATSADTASGGIVTLDWNDTNTGVGPATPGNWTDSITVVDIASGVTLFTTNVPVIAGGPLAFGSSVPEQYSFTLPGGATIGGTLAIVVATDVNDDVAESNANGTAETNNSAGTTMTVTATPLPYVSITQLQVNPTPLTPGSTINITWLDQSSGASDIPAGSSWHDQLTIANSTTGKTLKSVSIPVQTTGLAIGSTESNAYSFTLPAGIAGTGHIQISVTTDLNSDIHKLGSSSTATLAQTSIAAGAVDLKTSAIQGLPTSLVAGDPVTLSWIDQNIGTGGVPVTTPSWIDHLTVTNSLTGKPIYDADIPVSNANPGPAYTVKYQFPLPLGLDSVGPLSFVVTTDINNTLGETDITNNSASTTTTAVAPPATVLDPAAGQLAFVYDRTTGDLKLDYNGFIGTPTHPFGSLPDRSLSNIELITSGGAFAINTTLLNYTSAGLNMGGGSLRTATDFVMLGQGAGVVPDGADFGQVLAPGLDPTELSNALRIKFNYYGSGLIENTLVAGLFVTNSLTTVIPPLIPTNPVIPPVIPPTTNPQTSPPAASLPDLQVTGLSSEPVVATRRRKVRVQWADFNWGVSTPLRASWIDRVTFTNLATGKIIRTVKIRVRHAGLTSESAIGHTYLLTLPRSFSAGVGVLVSTDITGRIAESNASGTGEANNAASMAVPSLS